MMKSVGIFLFSFSSKIDNARFSVPKSEKLVKIKF